jgi:hypothetical protein
MLKFLAAHAGLDSSAAASAMRPAMARMTGTRRSAQGPMEIGFGWMIAKAASGELIWHNGGTGGLQSFAGFDAKSRTAVVVLSNAQAAPGIDDIGRHLLDPSQPLAPPPAPPKQRQKISLDPSKLDAFTGNYQLMPNFVLAVTREGDRLMTQATGQGKFEIFAMSERVFFPTVVDAELEFSVDETGRATAVTLRQGGQTIKGSRVQGDPPGTPKAGRTAITLGEAALQGLTGRYQLGPGMEVVLTREGQRLFAQLTGQGAAEVFAESETRFFYQVVDAQLVFTRGADGKATKVTLYQGGMVMEAKRVE